ncbi:MAG: hypothetical protein R3322_15145 [Kiloniellales bacterium]|nr:hypothetical protein [Kiloniellales bacterium]
MLFIESLKRTLLQYGDLNLVQACAAELAMLKRQAAALKPDENAERPKGIRALMGVD